MRLRPVQKNTATRRSCVSALSPQWCIRGAVPHSKRPRFFRANENRAKEMREFFQMTTHHNMLRNRNAVVNTRSATVITPRNLSYVQSTMCIGWTSSQVNDLDE